MKTRTFAALAVMAALILSTGALASTPPHAPFHLVPGSALIYPLYDSTAGAGTLICVTNTNTSRVYCPNNDHLAGDILLHFQYIAGDTCYEFDRYELLTPGDTLCVIADKHNPEQGKGFLVVSAAAPTTGDKIKFDYLIGSAILVQSDLNFLWAYTPYVFRGVPQSSTPPPCLFNLSDLDGDDALDFDGAEYDAFPAELFLDSFFEETGNFTNQLTLLSTAGQDYINEMNFLFWNNIEEKFSRTFKFVCWWSGPLSEISTIAKGLGGDPEELGHPPVETGWLSIAGNRILDLAGNPVEIGDGVPPVLGVFAQFITSTNFAAGRALQYRGSIDGLEILNGNGI